MEKRLIRFAEEGTPSTLLFHVPEGISMDGTELVSFAIPVKARTNGLLLCLPRGVVSEEALIQSLAGDDVNSLLGPSKLIEVSLCEEGENGAVVALPGTAHCYVVDFSDDVLPFLTEYDGVPDSDSEPIVFSDAFPAALPETPSMLEAVVSWLSQQGPDRVNFYSAREEQEQSPTAKANVKGAGVKRSAAGPKRVTNAQVMESLAALTAQVKLIATRQQQFEEAAQPFGENM